MGEEGDCIAIATLSPPDCEWRKCLKAMLGVLVECCFTSTETVGLLGRQPRTATSTFIQLLSCARSLTYPFPFVARVHFWDRGVRWRAY